jgi:hypothetical protein
VNDDQFALVMQAGDNMVRVAKPGKFTPAPYTVLGWEETKIEDEVRTLRRTSKQAYGPRPTAISWHSSKIRTAMRFL